jgi:uncharacterized membrane protein HdeD (DUF308 family)
MNGDAISAVKNRINYWWLSLVLGVLFVIVGFWTLQTPIASFVALSLLFGAFMFVSGLMELIFSIANRRQIENWGWHLTAAIIDFIVGGVLLLYPQITMTVLPFMVAFYFLFKGFVAMGLSLDLKRIGARKWGWLMFLGVLSLLFSVLIFVRPVVGGLTIVITTGIAFISLGIFKIFAAFALKSIRDKVQGIKEGIKT